VLNDISQATQNAIAATSETRVGLAQMPVLARLVDEAEKSKPLAGHRLFAVQHLFASSAGLFEGLLKAGVQAQGSVVFGKSYSTNEEVKAELEGKGFEVYGDFSQKQVTTDGHGTITGLESPLLSSLRGALESAAAAKPPQRLLLLDEGGKLNRMLHDVFPQYADLCTIVEQTTNGIQQMAGTTLKAPVVSVAASQLKREVEGPIIGEDVAASTLDSLHEIDPRLVAGKTIGIVGYGAVGSATALAFAKRGFKVVVTDINPAVLAKLKAQAMTLPGGGSIEIAPRAQVLGAGVIVGCTGTGAMTLEESAALKDGAILVSASSGDYEFPHMRIKAAKQQGANKDHAPMKEWQGLFDRAQADQANPKRGPVVITTVIGPRGEDEGVERMPLLEPATEPRVGFPVGDGSVTAVAVGQNRLGSFAFQQGQRRFLILRGGTPINLSHDLPPNTIQLTRSMLFAACVQAVGESGTGWKTFNPTTQQGIEAHWRSLQG
jgi:S-adenosylhomocysteine hydrolase